MKKYINPILGLMAVCFMFSIMAFQIVPQELPKKARVIKINKPFKQAIIQLFDRRYDVDIPEGMVVLPNDSVQISTRIEITDELRYEVFVIEKVIYEHVYHINLNK